MSSGNFRTCAVAPQLAPCDNPAAAHMKWCGKHGGQTAEVWALHHLDFGWMIDADVGGSYSLDVDDAKWWASRADAMLELERSDILSPNSADCERFRLLRLK